MTHVQQVKKRVLLDIQKHKFQQRPMVHHVINVVLLQKCGMDHHALVHPIPPNMLAPARVLVHQVKQTKMVSVRHHYTQHVKHTVKTEIQHHHQRLAKPVVM